MFRNNIISSLDSSSLLKRKLDFRQVLLDSYKIIKITPPLQQIPALSTPLNSIEPLIEHDQLQPSLLHLSELNAYNDRILKEKQKHNEDIIAKLLAASPLARKIAEPIFEKLLKYFRNPLNPLINISEPIQCENKQSHHQGNLLRQINHYRELTQEEKISEIGHCNGIALLWLAMMSIGLEVLFYKMISTIASCPKEQLPNIGPLISLFHDLIDVGQDPAKYSHRSCNQRNVVEIMGGSTESIYNKTKRYYRNQLRRDLKALREEGNMILLQGWDKRYMTRTTKGHSVAVFIRNDVYHFFDPNFHSGKPVEFSKETFLAKEIWSCLFYQLKVKVAPNPLFSVVGAKGIYNPLFFSKNLALEIAKEKEKEIGLRCHKEFPP